MLTILSAGLVLALKLGADWPALGMMQVLHIPPTPHSFLELHCSDKAWHRGDTPMTSIKSLIHTFLSDLLLL